MPAETTASTPLPCNSSASAYAPNGRSRKIATSTSESDSLQSSQALTMPRASPTPTPTPTASANNPSPGQTATAPTTTVVNSTRPTESSATGRMLARRLTYELSNAALNSSGGSTPNSTMSGLSSMLGIHGTKERARPPATRTNGA